MRGLHSTSKFILSAKITQHNHNHNYTHNHTIGHIHSTHIKSRKLTHMEATSTEKAPVLAMSFPHTGAHSSPQVLSAPTITPRTPTITTTGPLAQTQTPLQAQAQQVPPPLAKETSDTDVSEMSMDLQDSNSSHHSDESISTENRRDMRQFQRHQSKERTIEQVLEKGKILKVSEQRRIFLLSCAQ